MQRQILESINIEMNFRLLDSCTRNASCCREDTWKEADRRQWICHDKEKYVSFTHPLSFLISHSSFSYCSGWALHVFWPHFFLYVFSFMPSFFCILSLFYLTFHFFSSSSAFPLTSLLAFPFPQSLCLQPLLTLPLFLCYIDLYIFLGCLQGPTGRV